jgi:hypothetical protein
MTPLRFLVFTGIKLLVALTEFIILAFLLISILTLPYEIGVGLVAKDFCYGVKTGTTHEEIVKKAKGKGYLVSTTFIVDGEGSVGVARVTLMRTHSCLIFFHEGKAVGSRYRSWTH